MRIAQLTSLVERVPPRKYGGIERVVYYLTEELVRRNHNVTLFATADSRTRGKLVSISTHPLREMAVDNPEVFNILNVTKAYKDVNGFDIIHNHLDYYAFQSAAYSPIPTVTTLHGPITSAKNALYKEYKNLNYVSISNAQRNGAEKLNWRATIYNGIPVEEFPFGRTPKDYLLIVGRITKEKGTHIAIDVAESLNKKLIIAAKLDKVDVAYFNKYIKPRLKNKQIHWVGEVDSQERNKLMSEAICLLHPVLWPEPFGLVLTEAMATGCPVIGFDLGSIPEILVDGKTGFVVHGEKEMVQAVKSINTISREYCRKHVQENFNLKKMVDDYEKVYDEIIHDRKNAPEAQ